MGEEPSEAGRAKDRESGQFQGGVELVANFAEAFGVIALGDNGKGLADHKGNNGNGDQQCQFVRNLQ